MPLVFIYSKDISLVKGLRLTGIDALVTIIHYG